MAEIAVTKPGDADYPLKASEGAVGSIDEIRKRFNKDNLYEDPDFPPTDASIGGVEGDSAHGQEGIGSGKYDWRRPHEICSKLGKGKPNFAVGQQADCGAVGGRCSALDIRQGSLGDCGWLTAMAAVSRNSELLNIVIPVDNYDGFDDEKYCGAFHFRVFDMHAGKYADVVVDDLIPCDKKDDLPWFAKPFTYDDEGKEVTEFWVSLAEKAFAKFRGAYRQLERSHSICNLEIFTGGFDGDWYMEEYRGKPERYDELHANVKYSLNQGHCLLLSAIADEETADAYKKFGLATPHAYAVLGGTEVCEKDGGPTRLLLKARNPWGRGEWKGPLSDGDDEGWAKLEQDLRRRDAKGSTNIDEGVFWIDLRDVIKYFKSVEYCIFGKNAPGIRSEWSAELQEKKLALGKNLDLMPAFKFEIKSGAKPMGKNGKCSPALQFVLGEAGIPLDPLPRFKYFICPLEDGDDLKDLKKIYSSPRPWADQGGPYETAFKRVEGIYLEPGKYIIAAHLQTDDTSKIPKVYVGKALPFSIRLYADPEVQLQKIN